MPYFGYHARAEYDTGEVRWTGRVQESLAGELDGFRDGEIGV